eukprot:CAMPEP_0178910704 /NCGR_PEP_ID=MMETSP0786-20121207/9243_1 /TAXON_ID=186022 /ORGANISM="Thalassionema frauenfeldii, Strain CCMP 1798" /LENGTH=228 /DNA_ID=CAMNT_0020582981 /DNA_START=15 /DNA_END=698 /DNA_ORIENTATION=+
MAIPAFLRMEVVQLPAANLMLIRRQRQLLSATTRRCRPFSALSTKNASPHKVLGVQTKATIDEIKSAFRKLAKKHHPDLNPGKTSMDRMSEIISAYEALTESDFGGGRDSSVALACEVLTLDELCRDQKHDIYSLRVSYPSQFRQETFENDFHQCVTNEHLPANSNFWDIETHPDDSVTDFKKNLEQRYGRNWGLENRQKDRYGLATGWEIVITQNKKAALEILGNHW